MNNNFVPKKNSLYEFSFKIPVALLNIFSENG